MAIETYISIITLNVNGLNAPTKRHRLAERIQKQDPYMCCLQETHFRPKDTYRLKVRGWKNIFHANRKQKKAGVQFSSVSQSCLTLCDPMNCSTPGLPIHHQLPEFTQTRVHRVGDAIQPSYPLSSPSPPAPNPSQHQSLFQ